MKKEPAKYEESVDISKVSEKTKEKITKHLQDLIQNPNKQILPEYELGQDLGLDSLDLAEVITYLEQQFAARNIKPEEIKTVAGLMKVADNIDRLQTQIETPEKVIKQFLNSKKRKPIQYPQGSNLAHLFIQSCLTHKSSICMADEMTARVLTYEKAFNCSFIT